ncbi:MAG: (2Fe-2S)-binding protein [Candidatus Izemoplasmatales bacterium]|nr:(2Fe-2S)-binding protein [Candidatus Izemoplasmatales bacterium]
MAKIEWILNGTPISSDIDLSMRLLDYLRDHQHLKGPKEGCGEGECGACAVLIDHRIANSCLVPMANVAGHEVVTIEGFAKTKRYQIIQQAFIDCGAVQCGFCTPGMIIATESLLHHQPQPTISEIKVALSGNLCRCTGYNMIIEAITLAAKRGRGEW